MANSISKKAKEVLEALAKHKNVLISGAPATGKSRVLNEVAEAFINFPDYVTIGQPIHNNGNSVPIPRTVDTSIEKKYPSPAKNSRKVFRTTFHQNTKYREVISGIVPAIGEDGKYKVMEGVLYRASEYAKNPDSAALLIIDEINRGPAIEAFGGSIVAIEPDKRLDDNNQETVNTQKFEILNKDGEMEEYAFPSNLYILSAMNSADASIAPLDVAFLRRWFTCKLEPEESVLYDIYGVSNKDLVEFPSTAENIYATAIKAWKCVNRRITYGRGSDYQIGQGVFLAVAPQPQNDIDLAKEDIAEVWPYILTHIEECFWGDINSIASVLNINDKNTKHPYKMEQVTFADEERNIISYKKINKDNVYDLLLAIIGEENG